ncbi:hypothetical protein ACFQJ7_07525 [Halovenus rubra]|uniref:Flagellin n=2 Tax=Halovenus rubra TaxID=869890 RepID=A0ABD5X9Q6_9EURY|nr:hypothetical protein [Halovenus rubra]
MGFSTSASLLIIFFGAFIALGTVYTVASNTTEDVSTAYSDDFSAESAIVETGLSVEATYHETDGNLTLRADNDGATDLIVSEMDVLVDGVFRPLSSFDIVAVDDRGTDLWKTGEQLRIENTSASATRVKVITDTGVAATAPVTVVGFTNDSARTLDRTGNGTDSTISFDIETSYAENVTLQSVSVDTVAGAGPTTLNYAKNGSLSELNITIGPNHGTANATADGEFSIGETISHNAISLGPEETARYRLGEFRDASGSPVAMPSTTVSVTITFEDPYGVERTFSFTEAGF